MCVLCLCVSGVCVCLFSVMFVCGVWCVMCVCGVCVWCGGVCAGGVWCHGGQCDWWFVSLEFTVHKRTDRMTRVTTHAPRLHPQG